MVRYVELQRFAQFKEADDMRPLVASRCFVNSGCVGDLDQFLCTIGDTSYFCVYAAHKSLVVSNALTQLALGWQIWQIPLKDGYINTSKNPELLYNYFNTLPTNGLLYAMRGRKFVDLTRRHLLKVWPQLFRFKRHYQKLYGRYQNALQPLIEIQNEMPITEKVQQKLFGRKSAHTYELCFRLFIFLALVKKEKAFDKAPFCKLR